MLYGLTVQKFEGSWTSYTLFTFAFNALFFLGLSKDRIFFDSFIGTFFWLGFWLKFSVRTAFMGGRLWDPVGSFDYSREALDWALNVASIGALGLILAIFVRRKFILSYLKSKNSLVLDGISQLYKNYRKALWLGFIGLILFVGFINIYLGIYQRGQTPKTLLPFPLNGIITWLLFFGFASISAVFLNIEMKSNPKPYFAGTLALAESFLSNVSMLSRGLIINVSSLIWGGLHTLKQYNQASGYIFKLFVLGMFTLFLSLSVFTVNYMRYNIIEDNSYGLADLAKIQDSRLRTIRTNTIVLFLDRWVGMEGVMAVSQHPDLGWGLWKEAWDEKYTNFGTSLYDLKIAVDSPYRHMDFSKFHFISLPGIMAFMYYPGSLIFLFMAMFCAGILAALIEKFVFYFSGSNLILCALISQVVAYRFVHFGYVPQQSYLLFGSIILNILLIYGLNKLLLTRQSARHP